MLPGYGPKTAAKHNDQVEPALVRIVRKSDNDIKMRDLYVKIDDGVEQNLKFGSEIELPVEPGEHTVYATNRVYKRHLEFSIDGIGEVPAFEVANTVRGCAGALFTLGFGPYQCELRRIGAQ